MTVSSETSKSGPYTGNGVTVAFPYGFRILDTSHIRVVRTEGGADTVLTTGFTVSGVGSASGSVTFSVAPTAAQKITLIRDVPNTQELDLVNQGAYFAEDVEQSFDLAAMRDQQMAEELTRAVKLPVGEDPSLLNTLTENIIRLYDSADEIDTVAGIEANVNTVAGISTSVTTVAGIALDVTTVADVAASVPVVAAVDTEVTTVAGIASDVTTVAGIASDVTTVSGVASNVTTVAGLTAEIAALPGQLSDAQDAAAAAEAALDSFDDRYLGAKAVAPTVDNDGNALLVGSVYWDTVSSQMFTWSGAEWRPTFLTGNAVRQLTTATGGQTAVTVPTYLVGANTIQVYLNGLKVMVGADYTETDQNAITFLSGLTAGDEVEVLVLQPYAIGTTGAESITTEYGVTLARLLELREGSVADLLADTTLNPAVVPVGSVIEAGGFRYEVAASGASDEHIATAGGVKLYVQPGESGYNIKAFGAVGDGVADDTAEIQAAIDAGEVSGNAVFIPAGTFKITSTLNIGSLSGMVGEGTKSVIQPHGCDGLNFTGASNQTGSHVFMDFAIIGVNTASANSAIKSTLTVASGSVAQGYSYHNLTISLFQTGVYGYGWRYSSFRGIYLYDCWRGFYLEGRSVDILIDKCFIFKGANSTGAAGTSTGVYAGILSAVRPESLHITNCEIYGHHTGISLQSTYYATVTSTNILALKTGVDIGATNGGTVLRDMFINMLAQSGEPCIGVNAKALGAPVYDSCVIDNVNCANVGVVTGTDIAFLTGNNHFDVVISNCRAVIGTGASGFYRGVQAGGQNTVVRDCLFHVTSDAVHVSGSPAVSVGPNTVLNGAPVSFSAGRPSAGFRYWDKGSFTATLTGMSGTTTGTVEWQANGSTVTLTARSVITGTSSSTGMNLNGMPIALVPNATTTCMILGINNGASTVGAGVIINTTGQIVLFPDPQTATSWTAAGTKGISAQAITWAYD